MTVWDIIVRFLEDFFYFPLRQDFGLYNPTLVSLWYMLVVVVTILCLGYLCIRFKQSFTDKKRFQQMLLVVLWLVIGILFFGFYKRSIYDYYFEFMFPLPFLLVGGLLADAYDIQLFKLKNGKITMFIKAVVVLSLVGMTSIFYYFPAQRFSKYPLQKDKDIADFVLDKTDGKAFNFALITGGNSDHGYRYFFMREGREPVVIQNPMIDPKRETVTDQLLVICDSLPCSPLGHSLWEIAGFGRAEIVGHWKVAFVEVYKLVPYTEK
jgi:hypothetical protein